MGKEQREEIKNKIIDIIIKARDLGWVQTIRGEPFIHLADVEKIIFALFDKTDMDRIDRWIEEKKQKKHESEGK